MANEDKKTKLAIQDLEMRVDELEGAVEALQRRLRKLEAQIDDE